MRIKNDIWNEGWDEKEKTVLPDTLTEAAIKIIKKHPVKRFIIHYVQPHAPYINLNLKNTKASTFRFRASIIGEATNASDASNEDQGIRLKFIDKFLVYFNKLKKLINTPNWILGNQPKWRLRKFFHLDPLV